MLMPMKTVDSARPRNAGGTMVTASADAVAVNMAPAPMSARPIRSVGRFGATADSRQPAVNSASENCTVRFFGQRAVSTMNSGARTAVAMAYAVMTWPAAATLMPSATLTGCRMPFSAKALLPMTRLQSAKK